MLGLDANTLKWASLVIFTLQNAAFVLLMRASKVYGSHYNSAVAVLVTEALKVPFTVSLLIGDLAYGLGSERDEFVKIGVLTGSLVAAALASLLLLSRNATYRRICNEETVDENQDGVPDVYESRQD